jgi:hypothetical protein
MVCGGHNRLWGGQCLFSSFGCCSRPPHPNQPSAQIQLLSKGVTSVSEGEEDEH